MVRIQCETAKGMAQSTAVHRLVSECMTPQVCAATILSTHSHDELATANFLLAHIPEWKKRLII